MAKRAQRFNKMNHERQKRYLSKGVVMIPTLKEERKGRKKQTD